MNKTKLQRLASLHFGEKLLEHRWHGELSMPAYCRKCKKLIRTGGLDSFTEAGKNPCTIPDPIDINDIGLAMKAFRELRKSSDIEDALLSACYRVSRQLEWYEFTAWMMDEATPAQIFEIAVRAKQT